MSFSYLKKLPTPAEIREQYPLSERGKEIKRRKDQALRDIFTGKSDKFLVVIGPVSYTHLRAHETAANPVCRLLLEKKNFFNDTATTEIYTLHIVGSVRCV